MAERASRRVVVVGSYNHDLIFPVPRFPAPGETLLGSRRLEAPGGKGSNQAIQAARCGASVGMIAALGLDAAGDQALRMWADEGIDTSGVARIEGAGTGTAVILVDAAGENQIVVDLGANASLATDAIEAAGDLLRGANVVVAQLEVPLEAVRRAFEIARAATRTTLLNAAPAPDALDKALLTLTDILVVNVGEGRILTGEIEPEVIAAALVQRVGIVIVTLGAAGVLVRRDGEGAYRVPAAAARVVDTTGAGDAFVGALAAQLAGRESLSAAVAFAVAAGALACERQGASASFAGLEMIERRLSVRETA